MSASESPGPEALNFLLALPCCGVLICTTHSTAYSLSNYQRHVLREHHIKGPSKKRVEEWVEAQGISSEVAVPGDYEAPITGLPITPGWVCNVSRCTWRTSSKERIERHSSSEHQVDSQQAQREKKLYTAVQLQAFFAKTPEYFIVKPQLHLASTDNKSLLTTLSRYT